MIVKSEGDNVAFVMTAEELGLIRYALSYGVDSLKSKASYSRAMGASTATENSRVAKQSEETAAALEAASLVWSTEWPLKMTAEEKR